MPFSAEVTALIQLALLEDDAAGDITTAALIPEGMAARAEMQVKTGGVIAGLPIAAAVFQAVDETLVFTKLVTEGSTVHAGDRVAQISGPAGSILRAERVALNFTQRLSGIASLTRRYVDAVAGTSAHIWDTRKTTPGLRELEKYAVCQGGGKNHRGSLSQAVLIKDNHLAALDSRGIGLAAAVTQARRNAPPGTVIEVEVTDLDEARTAAEAGADVILLDNMTPDEMREVVRELGGRVKLEASGGINLDTVRAVAQTGVDIISVGALTHSVPALDISLDFQVTD
jgi:nicotinate-nucleotide pyrophosphorylase (carboxylating)